MIKECTLTVLAENRVNNPKLFGEQGLSILIHTPDASLLFDTGQTDTFLKNARQLELNLQTVEAIVLSHGHYDHGGGLPHFLKAVKPVPVYCHPALLNKKFRDQDSALVDIGVPWEKTDIIHAGGDLIFKTHAFEIFPGIWYSGEIPRHSRFESIDESYRQRVLESYIHDELHDDISLILQTKKGLIVLLGCGHSGVINTVKHAMRITGEKRLYAVMGGMHLQLCSDEKIENVVKHLKALNPEYVIPLHCTGFRAVSRLYRLFKDRMLLFNAGDAFNVV
ncbi:MAG TPA: MBL fold metallo-hydrolase [Caldithrix abyssi]|uniref:MBL fold metallo-hydrolase n=1 Tax=Caldithrix abyssi TaxID=187145 RepID=A0A7V4U289_CALAY|nr:MBL fold metallo-hydrolase [Caldithrix abyssi]